MKKVNSQLTAEQGEKLLADISASGNDDEHLSDDDFVALAAGLARVEDREQTKAHMEKCSGCAAEMQEFISQTEAWRTEEAEQQLVVLRDRLLSAVIKPVEQERTVTLWGQLGDFVSGLMVPNPFSLTPQALYTTPVQVPSYETEDRLFGISFHEEEKGLLTVYLDSRRMELEGEELLIETGAKQWRATLRRVDSDQLSASVTMRLNELRRVHGTEFSIRIAGIQTMKTSLLRIDSENNK